MADTQDSKSPPAAEEHTAESSTNDLETTVETSPELSKETPKVELHEAAATAEEPVPKAEEPQSPSAQIHQLNLGNDMLDLFGEVSIPSDGILPLAGPTYETAKMTQILLQENHLKWHTFMNAGGLHNHLSHHVLASYSLGAPSQTLKACFQVSEDDQSRPLEMPTYKINDSNFGTHLGDGEAYSAYLAFFHLKVQERPALQVIEQFVFADSTHRLLVRMVSGAIHPLIQTGYGVEFGLDALVCEGLAQACVHSTMSANLFSPTWPLAKLERYRSTSISASFSSFASKFSGSSKKESFLATARTLSNSRKRTNNLGLSGFTILSQILKDPELAAGQVNKVDDSSKFTSALENKGEQIKRWTEEWVIDADGGWEEIVSRTEELFYLATVIYASSSRPGYATKLDFFQMHALTSVLFLPSFLEGLKPSSRIALLHSHFKVMIAYWISRGRPELHIKDTLMAATSSPTPPNLPNFNPGALEKAAAEIHQKKEGKGKERAADQEVKTPTLSTMAASRISSTNPWPAVISSAADHTDDHLPKVIRSLAYAASLWGSSPPSIWKSALPDSNLLDGTIFIRAAGMTLDTIGWCREDEIKSSWDRSCVGFDSAWEGASN